MDTKSESVQFLYDFGLVVHKLEYKLNINKKETDYWPWVYGFDEYYLNEVASTFWNTNFVWKSFYLFLGKSDNY